MRTSALLLLLTACAGARISGTFPTPFGPANVTVEFGGNLTSLASTGTTRVVNGKTYEVYRDNLNTDWLRDPNPPHLTVPASQIKSVAPVEGSCYWDFTKETYAGLCSRARLAQLTGAGRESFDGLAMLAFDPTTLETHVVYPMRADIGVPHPSQHAAVRIEMQLLPGPTWAESFLSVQLRGDVRDVGAYLLAQGVKRIDGVRLPYADRVYDVSVVLDATTQTISFLYGAHVLRVIPLR